MIKRIVDWGYKVGVKDWFGKIPQSYTDGGYYCKKINKEYFEHYSKYYNEYEGENGDIFCKFKKRYNLLTWTENILKVIILFPWVVYEGYKAYKASPSNKKRKKLKRRK